jgi:hypothetical protein
MSKKQTSIEWLAEQVKDWLPDHFNEVFEQAKAMHKEEIIESYCTGCLHMAEDETIFPRETSERYYDATYNDPPPPKPHIPFIYR